MPHSATSSGTAGLPLFDGGTRYGLHEEREALEAQARTRLEGALRQARSEVRRALRSKNSAWLMTAETVAGWNASPTPFVWHGKRYERRQRARLRRLGGSPATLAHPQLLAA